MVELNHRERTIKVKVVYYGPPVGGKTTNLQVLHRAANAHRRGEMISINSAQDRTILFDLLPLKTPGFRGFDLRLQLLAVPGQAVYAATRRLVLKGADSLVFVANSALDRWEENVQSYREMTHNLLSHHLDPTTMPLVFQYNKRDLPQVLEIEALDRALNARDAEAIPAVAMRGEGVLETFTAILAHTVEDMAQRYSILNVKEGTPVREWAEHTAAEIFGAPRVSSAAAAVPAEESAAATVQIHTPRSVQVKAAFVTPSNTPLMDEPPLPPLQPRGHTIVRAAPVSEERPSGSTAALIPDGRAIELVESYAETSVQLGAAVESLRDERDAAMQRLQDLRQTMQAAQEILAGTPFEAALGPVLARMARVAGVEHAAFWVPQSGAPPKAVALLGLARDPVLAVPGALRYVSEAATRGVAPGIAQGGANADLAHALTQGGERFAAVLAVPFRTPGGLQAVGAFYYTPDAAQPGDLNVAHLAEIAKALSAALELSATLQTVKAAERALELALTGSASIRGLEAVVRSVEQLRDRMSEIRHRTDAPPWFVDHYLRLAPALSAALDDGRSLLGFAKGEIRRGGVYVEDLLSELRTPEVEVEIEPAVELIAADATLLRVALRAMADEVRSRVGSNTVPLIIRTGIWSDGVRFSVQTQTKVALEAGARSVANAGLGLGLARRIAQLHGGALDDPSPQAAGPIMLTMPIA